jgi:ABC-type antimicrobial peptide transport system permease subunit
MSTDEADPVWTPVTISVLVGLPLIVGFLIGIAPGLLLGLAGIHGVMAIVTPVVFAGWYVWSRSRRMGQINMVMVIIGIVGAIGIGVSIWLFGTLTS